MSGRRLTWQGNGTSLPGHLVLFNGMAGAFRSAATLYALCVSPDDDFSNSDQAIHRAAIAHANPMYPAMIKMAVSMTVLHRMRRPIPGICHSALAGLVT
jgi:hypothetical protein